MAGDAPERLVLLLADAAQHSGDAATEILRVAQEERADLIMMSSHGRTGLGQLGSVTEQVVRKAPCQVVTVEVPPLDTQAFDERLWTFTRVWLLERIKNLEGHRSFLALRPGDAHETTEAWKLALEAHGPAGLVLTRQPVAGFTASNGRARLPGSFGANTAGEDIDNLYRVFLETCDIYLGFKAIADAYPPWLAVTRPYYRTSYIMVTANAAWTSLADMPRSQALGATIGTSADIRLVQYLQALAPGDRWSRFPMGSDELALRALMRNTIGAALVWAPSFWALRQSDASLAALRVISLKPLADSTVDVAATLLARESFLRSNIDQAIAALTADGSIQAILESEKFPAAPVK
jgi:hypothetical protein